MAEKIQITLIPDDICKSSFVEVIENGKSSYRGFNLKYLARELSDLERDFVSCAKCYGVARDAFYIGEEIFCQSCICFKQIQCASVAQRVRSSVSKLKIRCPLLRGCDWVGYLLEGEVHLQECNYFRIECPEECGAVFERIEKENHFENCCPMRRVECEFCKARLYFLELTGHLISCPSLPIDCTGCGDKILRIEHGNHIDSVCPMAEIECPYAKYSCKIGKILRSDLLAHKKDFYIEHQDMIELENCLLKQELSNLKLKHEEDCRQLSLVKKDLGGVEMEVDTKLRTIQTILFHNGSYEFSCGVIVDDFMSISLTRLPSKNENDEKLICITYCKVYVKDSKIEDNPCIIQENLYANMAMNQVIAIKILERKTYSKYIQEDGRIYLRFLFDYDYVTIGGMFSNLSLQLKNLK